MNCLCKHQPDAARTRQYTDVPPTACEVGVVYQGRKPSGHDITQSLASALGRMGVVKSAAMTAMKVDRLDEARYAYSVRECKMCA